MEYDSKKKKKDPHFVSFRSSPIGVFSKRIYSKGVNPQA